MKALIVEDSWSLVEIIRKERNEQANLGKEVMTKYDKLEDWVLPSAGL